MISPIYYIREFLRAEWLKKFFFAKTAPLKTPEHFRDYPVLTGAVCTHEYKCVMICPVKGAIEVVRDDSGVWNPVIHKGHCLRCGLCVEACPERVLTSGRILDLVSRDKTYILGKYHLRVDNKLCMKCGNCAVACPVNKAIDPVLGHTATSSGDNVIMRIKDSKLTILHEELCTGCKTCQETCPNRAIRVYRVVMGTQQK